MSLANRLFLFTVCAIIGVAAWHYSTAPNDSRELTHLALQQFNNDAAVPGNLQQASLAQNWWPLVWPALIVALGLVMFWDDFERWFKREEN